MPAPSKYPGVPMKHAPSLWLPLPVWEAAKRKATKDVTVSDVLRAWIIEASGVRLPTPREGGKS